MHSQDQLPNTWAAKKRMRTSRITGNEDVDMDVWSRKAGRNEK